MEASVATQAPVGPAARTGGAIGMRVESLTAYYGLHKAIENIDMVIEPHAVTVDSMRITS
jgi:hypothetical protein